MQLPLVFTSAQGMGPTQGKRFQGKKDGVSKMWTLNNLPGCFDIAYEALFWNGLVSAVV
jgi:hypothetical protein